MMDFKIEDIFTGYKRMIMDLKKPSYEANMKEFRGERGQFADDMLKHVKASPDKAAACAELGKAFADEAHEVFSRGGRIKGHASDDIPGHALGRDVDEHHEEHIEDVRR